ncbi:NlpC/P60 family protein [Nocardia brasiliensis]|uniref:C40 family peptidase n=1 Tax=Nocardia brasiliensis TaxID=37326 RepID=UPI00189312C1|nr:bifunctional lytic transglycosylase/C40 family peptidase [Nocardia brasiliensis]MBF6545283.1 bifunctional lytic transglycosylase/C40 family peptidase [Nocardia brasiliensis]
MLVKTLAAGCGAVVFCVVVIAAVVTTVVVFGQSLSTPPPPSATGPGSVPSSEAQHDIPAEMLVLYRAAAGNCPGLDWSVLAAIGKIETDHGRSPLPGVSSGENPSGAAGPMQFLAPTFESVTTRHRLPAGGASPPSRYNPSDAVHAAAFYLCDSGAPADLRAAIFAYNHADWYVDQILGQAARYRATETTGGDCRADTAANPTAVQVISFACAQLGLPYVWGGNGPDVNGGWDCSGLTQAAYRTAGISIPRTTHTQVHVGATISEDQLAPGDLVFYGTAADVHHVGIYLGGGQMVHAPTFNQPVQVSPYRWTDDDYYTATRPSPTHGGNPRAAP